jgi:hypothetical protein
MDLSSVTLRTSSMCGVMSMPRLGYTMKMKRKKATDK